MATYSRTLYIVGAIAVILGSFLPWQREGDFISYWTYGLQVHPSFKDNGGFLIVFLSAVILGLALWSPVFRRLIILIGLLSSILVLLSVYHIGKWLIRRIEAVGAVGAPSLQWGLIVVLGGSLVLLSAAIRDHKRAIE